MFDLLLILVVILIVAGLVYLARLDGTYEVRRSRSINANVDVVFDKIRDFKSWPDWSPWLIHEPNTALYYSADYSEEGGFYTWDGQLVGAGRLTHKKFDRPHRIHQSIEFTRPFKSVCKVEFEFEQKNGQTEITWVLQGQMPFLFRFMTKKTKAMIAKDYDLGLAMLGGELDPQSEFPRIQFMGDATLDPVTALCEYFEGPQIEMERAMQQGFPALENYIIDTKGTITGQPFTAYHNVTKDVIFECDMSIPVMEGINQGNYTLKHFDGGRFYQICLMGSYEFLELAWYSAIAHVKMMKLKVDQTRPMLEIYENDPRQIADTNELQTTLYIPLK